MKIEYKAAKVFKAHLFVLDPAETFRQVRQSFQYLSETDKLVRGAFHDFFNGFFAEF